MFERLTHPHYWKSMVRAYMRTSSRVPKPLGLLLGWEVWVMDGKAFLFKGNAVRRADWFEFCWCVRRWVKGGMMLVLSVRG
jgi:hypothetical protein